MNKIFCIGTAIVTLALVACQTPRPYNGVTGYEVENKAENSATIRYIMGQRANQAINESRLQQVCQQVLGKQQQYQIQILSQQEVSAPKYQSAPDSVQVGDSRMKIGFSNSPDLHNSEGYAGRQVNETRPNVLTVVRYQCQ